MMDTWILFVSTGNHMPFTQCLFTKRFQGNDAGSQGAEMKARCNTCNVILKFEDYYSEVSSATYEFL